MTTSTAIKPVALHSTPFIAAAPVTCRGELEVVGVPLLPLAGDDFGDEGSAVPTLTGIEEANVAGPLAAGAEEDEAPTPPAGTLPAGTEDAPPIALVEEAPVVGEAGILDAACEAGFDPEPVALDEPPLGTPVPVTTVTVADPEPSLSVIGQTVV